MKSLSFCALAVAAAAAAASCGARSTLNGSDVEHGGGGGGAAGHGGVGGIGGVGGVGTGGVGGIGTGGAGGSGGSGGLGGSGGTQCVGDVGAPCDTGLLGVCAKGELRCVGGVIQCVQLQQPGPEVCNGLDDDCNGMVDDNAPEGDPCDTGLLGVCAAGAQKCIDGKLTCTQTVFPSVETCDGVDNDCNGIVDSDCTVGDCEPNLKVTGSTPSDPNCEDFPIGKGSTGTIEYPCGGGDVTATLDGIVMTGSVTNGTVALAGEDDIIGPDGCKWKLTHQIDGTIASGVLTYSYAEHLKPGQGGKGCWFPCTETGTVTVKWPH